MRKNGIEIVQISLEQQNRLKEKRAESEERKKKKEEEKRKKREEKMKNKINNKGNIERDTKINNYKRGYYKASTEYHNNRKGDERPRGYKKNFYQRRKYNNDDYDSFEEEEEEEDDYESFDDDYDDYDSYDSYDDNNYNDKYRSRGTIHNFRGRRYYRGNRFNDRFDDRDDDRFDDRYDDRDDDRFDDNHHRRQKNIFVGRGRPHFRGRRRGHRVRRGYH